MANVLNLDDCNLRMKSSSTETRSDGGRFDGEPGIPTPRTSVSRSITVEITVEVAYKRLEGLNRSPRTLISARKR